MRPAGASAAVAVLLAAAAQGGGQNLPEGRKLTAREIFYSAPKAAKRTRPAPSRAKAQAQPAAKQERAERAKSRQPPERQPSTEPAPLVLAVQKSLPPLGMRCSVLKREAATVLREVAPDSVFHSGDRIRLRVEVNDQGYLYVVHRGSSGVWKPLFPSSEIEAGDNRVDAAVSYDIPPGYVFTFDEQPGEEKLFVVFARQPVTDLEKLIYEVGRGRPGEPPAPKAGAEPKILLAENRIEIGDQVVSELRNAYARDLIIEKVDETTKAPGYAKETAVYAVAPQGAADSRVVVDLSLIHR